MKIKIEYDYVLGSEFPFKAFCWLENNYFVSTSRVDYEEARTGILNNIKTSLSKKTTPPEPEEVEI